MLRKKYGLFPSPRNASDDPETTDVVGDIFSSFGIEEKPPATPETPPAPEPEGEGGTPAPETDPPADDKTPEGTPEVTPPKEDKQQKAFAQMRTQNKQYNDLIKGIASVLGVQDTTPDAMMAALNEKVMAAQAKQQGVPLELLKEVQNMKAQNEAFLAEQTKRQAFLGFNTVKTEFKLNEAQLNTFADELVKEGLNPFEQQLDLKGEYIKRHYSDLLKAAQDEAIQAEQERVTKAQTHSTTPSGKQGEVDNPTGKINSIAELDAFMNTLKK